MKQILIGRMSSQKKPDFRTWNITVTKALKLQSATSVGCALVEKLKSHACVLNFYRIGNFEEHESRGVHT